VANMLTLEHSKYRRNSFN